MSGACSGHTVFLDGTKSGFTQPTPRLRQVSAEHEVKMQEQSSALPPAAKHCYRRGMRRNESITLQFMVGGHSFKRRGLTWMFHRS